MSKMSKSRQAILSAMTAILIGGVTAAGALFATGFASAESSDRPPSGFHKGEEAAAMISAEIDRFPFDTPEDFQWNAEPSEAITAEDVRFDEGVIMAYVASQWECAYKVEAVKASDAGDQAGVDAAVAQLERMLELPVAEQYWDQKLQVEPWYEWVINRPRAGDVSALVSEIYDGGGCDHYFAANPEAR